MKIIVLAGGSGSRLWPLGSPPKQFSYFIGEHTLFQMTLMRFLKNYLPEDFVIVTIEPFFQYAQNQAAEIHPDFAARIIIEKESRNTAQALIFALKWLEETNELGEYFLVTPSDHLIAPESLFLEKIKAGETVAKAGFHVLFGIFPTSPHTGYGYIRCDPNQEISDVDSFCEKPPLELAKEFLEKGNYLWNMGIFMFQTSSFFQDLQLHQPDLKALDDLSIDQALLEYSEKLKVLPLHLSWSDVGSWDNVYDLFLKDPDQNVFIGAVSAKNSRNCLVIGAEKPIAMLDIEDLIIVDSKEGLLITKRGSSQEVRFYRKQALLNS